MLNYTEFIDIIDKLDGCINIGFTKLLSRTVISVRQGEEVKMIGRLIESPLAAIKRMWSLTFPLSDSARDGLSEGRYGKPEHRVSDRDLYVLWCMYAHW